MNQLAITYNKPTLKVSPGNPVFPGWKKLASTEITAETTSTTAKQVGKAQIAEPTYNPQKVIWVRIRDKAGKRNGYFYGSDVFFTYYMDPEESTAYLNAGSCLSIRYNNGYSATAGQYGVYANSMNLSGEILIRARYNSSYSLTIDGTFVVDVYESVNRLI